MVLKSRPVACASSAAQPVPRDFSADILGIPSSGIPHATITRHPVQGTFAKTMCPQAPKPQLCRSFVSPTSNATAALARHRQNFDQTKHTGVCATSRSGTWRCSTKLLPTHPKRVEPTHVGSILAHSTPHPRPIAGVPIAGASFETGNSGWC